MAVSAGGPILRASTATRRLTLGTSLNDLLDNPAIQAAVLPFVAALVLSLALARSRYLAVAVVTGLLVVVALAMGVSFEAPLSSVKKLVVVTVALTVVALIAEAAGIAARRSVLTALAAATGLASLWVLERILRQAEGSAAVVLAVGAVALALASTASVLAAGRTSTLRGAVVAACLGWGSGVLALVGASALLAQLGLALGTAAAAVALVQMVRGRESPLGASLAVPVATAAPLIALLASATGELRWYALLPLPLAALAGWLVPTGALRKPWQAAFVIGFATLVPVAAAVAIAWVAARSAAAIG
jgi:hypothetical protein